MTPEETTSLIRTVEAEVLDKEFMDYHLLKLPEELAITRLLKGFGDMARDLLKGSAEGRIPAMAVHAYSSILTQSLSHCLRWVCQHCPSGSAVQSANWQQEDSYAHELIGWGVDYSKLAIDHVAWSNALIRANIDPMNRVISFTSPDNLDVGYLTRQYRADMDWWRYEMLTDFPTEDLMRIFVDWHSVISWQEAGLHYPPDFVRSHPNFPRILSWLSARLFPELDEDYRLSSYSIRELRIFYAVVYVTCELMRIVEDEIDRRTENTNWMGSATFQSPRAEFLDWLVQITGLDGGTADSVLRDMTLNSDRFHCSVTATPFVASRSNTIFLLPRLFSVLSPQRMLSTALTSGSGRGAYDRVSKALEQYHIDQLHNSLRGHGFRVARERPFVGSNGERLTPDFIVADASTNEIVVVDYKNSLGATGSLAVANRLKEYRKGVEQVLKYITVFTAQPPLLVEALGLRERPSLLHGLLVFRVPMPLPLSKGDSVLVDDWFTLRRRLEGTPNPSIRTLLPPDGSTLSMDLETTVQEIRVKSWQYRRTVLGQEKPG